MSRRSSNPQESVNKNLYSKIIQLQKSNSLFKEEKQKNLTD